MKIFFITAFFAFLLIGPAVRADDNGPVTLNDYKNFTGEQVASFYVLYIKALGESPKLDPDFRAFVIKEYAAADGKALEALMKAVRAAEDEYDGNTPVKKIVNHEIAQRYAAQNGTN